MILSEDRASQVEPAILLFRAYLETDVFNNSPNRGMMGYRTPNIDRLASTAPHLDIMNGNTDVDLADIYFRRSVRTTATTTDCSGWSRLSDQQEAARPVSARKERAAAQR